AGEDDGAEVFAVVFKECLSVLDGGREPGEPYGAVGCRAAPDRDEVEELVVLAGEDADVWCVRLDCRRGRWSDEGGTDRGRGELVDDVFEDGVPEPPVP